MKRAFTFAAAAMGFGLVVLQGPAMLAQEQPEAQLAPGERRPAGTLPATDAAETHPNAVRNQPQEQAAPAQDAASTGQMTEEERGKYIVHHVAMCVQCHSPRDDRGNLIEGQLLEGGALPAESKLGAIEFAFRAPALAGLPGYEPEALVRLLTTGLAKRGGQPAPPMPPFRMTEEDARAVATYLDSLH